MALTLTKLTFIQSFDNFVPSIEHSWHVGLYRKQFMTILSIDGVYLLYGGFLV